MERVPPHLAWLQPSTLRPPARSPQDDDDVAAGIPWVLLDKEAYIGDVSNHTTAYSFTELGRKIQVTFCFARPPSVSYFCVYCPGRDHTMFPREPQIVAMDENLVLLRIIVGPAKSIYKESHLFIYQADGADDGGPSLKRLHGPPNPDNCFPCTKVGLLRCRDGGGKKDEFIIASLHRPSEADISIPEEQSSNSGHTRFALYVYNSKNESWTVKLVSVDEPGLQKQPGDHFLHFNSKVISIGGEAGTMGFVDLFRGILLCDVLKGDTNLRYIPLPKPIWPGKKLRGDGRLHRDIVVVGDHIKYVELQVMWKLARPGSDGQYYADGWMARSFTRPVADANSVFVANLDAGGWSDECEIESFDEINVDGNTHFELLPKPLDDEGRPLPPFKGNVLCQPTLSLGNHDDPVYFMAKNGPVDDKGWVIAVDMKNKKLLDTAKFSAERTDVVTFAYVHSRISKYLTGPAGTKGKPQRTQSQVGGILPSSKQ